MGCLGGKTTLMENGLKGDIDLLNTSMEGTCSSLNGFTGNMQCLNVSLNGSASLVCTIGPNIPTDYYLRVSKTILWLSPSDLFDILSNTDWEIK